MRERSICWKITFSCNHHIIFIFFLLDLVQQFMTILHFGGLGRHVGFLRDDETLIQRRGLLRNVKGVIR